MRLIGLFALKTEGIVIKFSYVFLLTVALTFRTPSLLARLGNRFGLFLDLAQLKQVNDDTGK